jgi:hypothetical protein
MHLCRGVWLVVFMVVDGLFCGVGGVRFCGWVKSSCSQTRCSCYPTHARAAACKPISGCGTVFLHCTTAEQSVCGVCADLYFPATKVCVCVRACVCVCVCVCVMASITIATLFPLLTGPAQTSAVDCSTVISYSLQ